MSAPIYNPTVPLVQPLQGALYAGQMIRVQGEVHSSPNCFAINLQTGPRVNPRDDIALHISPVFTPPPRVVRNTLQAQRWGPEESHGGFPFAPNSKFEILILVEYDEYKVAINGAHFTQYRHRIPFNLVSYLAIDGDVRIDCIMFEQHGQTSAAPSAPPAAMGSMPPYPTGPGGMPCPPPPTAATAAGYPSGPMPYPSSAPMPYSSGSYATPVYPSSAAPVYPTSSGAYPTSSGLYPGASGAYPVGGYPYGPAAPSYGGYPHRKSSPIPIGGTAAGLAAGVGAAALGAAMLGHHPMKKMKKLYKFKHKFKKPKFFKHKFGKFHKMWKHKGWSSESSCSTDEE
ncbi:galectin-4-like protein [Dinothrombium tinctorium]|uniref:Galectin n=1 Tax=Dinothrombium tinctorium TaxID=1965070 RepID=A0A443QNU6_9ACAR|nr:galectin-4-like protein [Dinothrombium tinctorium]